MRFGQFGSDREVLRIGVGRDGRGRGIGAAGGWVVPSRQKGLGKEGPSEAVIEVVFRSGLRLGGIELGHLIEVAREDHLGGLSFRPAGKIDGELRLGWSPGRMVKGVRWLCSGIGIRCRLPGS